MKHRHKMDDKERLVLIVVDFDNSEGQLVAVVAAGCGWCFYSSDARSLPLPNV